MEVTQAIYDIPDKKTYDAEPEVVPTKSTTEQTKVAEKPYYREIDKEDTCYEETEPEVKTGYPNDGTPIHVSASQVRDKGHHIDDFLDPETLDGKFDPGAVREAKSYEERLEYLRDKENLPDEIVYKTRDRMLSFMTNAEYTLLIPGFLGYGKLPVLFFSIQR